MDLSFNHACEEFLIYEKRNLKFQTYLLAERAINLHLLPFFKDKKIKDITKKDILNWQAYMEKKGNSNRFNSSVQTKLNQLYDYLVTFYDLEYNIARAVPNFKRTKVKPIENVWTMNEARRFLHVAKTTDIRFYTLYYALFFTGLRQGELLALKIKDFDGKRLSVNHSLSQAYSNGKRVLGTPKNGDERIKYLDIFTKWKIERLINFYRKNYSDFNDDFFLFGGKEPLATTTIRRTKNKICKLAKVKQIRIHDFRHSRATLIFKETKDIKRVQEELGHKSIEVSNNYIHEKGQEKRALAMLNLLHLKIF